MRSWGGCFSDQGMSHYKLTKLRYIVSCYMYKVIPLLIRCKKGGQDE